MQRIKAFVIVFLFFFITGGCVGQVKIPKGLRKLNHTEIIERVKAGKSAPIGVEILTEDGKPFSSADALKEIAQKSIFPDQYVDSANVVRLIVFHKSSPSEKKLLEQLEKIDINSRKIKLINVDCLKIKQLLKGIYEKDQQFRNNTVSNPQNFDLENQQIVVSILEKCGFHALNTVDNSDLTTMFLVIHHGTKQQRAKYFKYFSDLSDKGLFNRSLLALMEDRILIDQGKKQKYGTQVVKDGNGKWVLLPVEMPEDLDERRSEIGLMPIQDYMKSFDPLK